MDNLPKQFLNAVAQCDEAQLDAAFAVLKYHQIGILRKTKCFATIFRTDESELVQSLPTTDDGRILDKISRGMFCEIFINRQNNS